MKRGVVQIYLIQTRRLWSKQGKEYDEIQVETDKTTDYNKSKTLEILEL